MQPMLAWESMPTKESGSSGIKIWVAPPGKPPGMMEVVVEGEGNLERTTEEWDNEYWLELRPAVAPRDIVFPTILLIQSFLLGREVHRNCRRAAPWKCVGMCIWEAHSGDQSSHAGLPLRSPFQRTCYDERSWLSIPSCCISWPGRAFILRLGSPQAAPS